MWFVVQLLLQSVEFLHVVLIDCVIIHQFSCILLTVGNTRGQVVHTRPVTVMFNVLYTKWFTYLLTLCHGSENLGFYKKVFRFLGFNV